MSHQKKGQKGKRNVEQERSFISTQFNAKCKTKHWKKVSKTFSKGNTVLPKWHISTLELRDSLNAKAKKKEILHAKTTESKKLFSILEHENAKP